jgi:hypothetical protein
MKLLMRKEAQALASLALPGVVVGEALDKELKVKNIEADFFFDAYLNDKVSQHARHYGRFLGLPGNDGKKPGKRS